MNKFNTSIVHTYCYYRYVLITVVLSMLILASSTSISASTITPSPPSSPTSSPTASNSNNSNNSSSSLPTIQITSHEDGQQVPVGELSIEGVSSDDKETNCQVYADVNDITPMPNVTAAGDSGEDDDFSKWTFTYTQGYQLIQEGENELTAKISCFFDGVDSSSNTTSATTTTTTIPMSEWHTVNVTAVAAAEPPTAAGGGFPGSPPVSSSSSSFLSSSTTKEGFSSLDNDNQEEEEEQGQKEGEDRGETQDSVVTSQLVLSSSPSPSPSPILNEDVSKKSISNLTNAHTTTSSSLVDKFGIKEIYPTKEGGREWYINNTYNPAGSHRLFFITSSKNATTQRSDGDSWLVNSPQFKINVKSPPGTEPWKNVEITGYAKVLSVIDPEIETDLTWFARSGRHNDEVPCEGTALTGIIHTDGSVEWKKEIWHTGGYTDGRAMQKITDSILGRWIGWKVVIYNINNDTAVKMESYLDDKNNNEWIKVTDLVDDGGWYAKSTDKQFYSADCGKPKDYIITNAGPLVTFRSDNVVWEFKNLSVREIDASIT
jgi:hypothetical protein